MKNLNWSEKSHTPGAGFALSAVTPAVTCIADTHVRPMWAKFAYTRVPPRDPHV